MSGKRTISATVLSCVLLILLSDCERLPQGRATVVELSVRILTDSLFVRSRHGEPLGGFLAEYELDFQTHRIFIALEIQKYEKGERLMVEGNFMDDSVRMPYADQINADFPVFHIQKAEPAPAKIDVEKVLPAIKTPK
jgi:hypothetical protein